MIVDNEHEYIRSHPTLFFYIDRGKNRRCFFRGNGIGIIMDKIFDYMVNGGDIL